MLMAAYGRLQPPSTSTSTSSTSTSINSIAMSTSSSTSASSWLDPSVRSSFPHTLLVLAMRPFVICGILHIKMGMMAVLLTPIDNDILLLHLLHAIQQFTQQDPNDANPPPYKKLADQYAKLRHTIPPATRNHIQKILPFLAPTPAPLTLHNPNTNSWTLLEDYPDAPLSPSMWGGVRVERTEPAYAKVAFANAEPPPPKKLKM